MCSDIIYSRGYFIMGQGAETAKEVAHLASVDPTACPASVYAISKGLT